MTKIEQKFQVAANSKIGDIYGKLNSVQKQTVSLFDTDRNGMLDAKEAKAFNSTVFAEKDDRIDCWLQLKSGKKTKTTVMKKDIDTTALNLEKIEVGTKNIGNKKVHYIQSKLNKIQAGSNKKMIEKRFAENSAGYDYESQDKKGNVKYSRTEYYGAKEHVILNKFGEVVESSEILENPGEHGGFAGHIVTKGDNKKYYDEHNKFVGSEEQLKNGRIAYKNAKGEVLYQTLEKNSAITYFDKEGKALYKVNYPLDDSYRECKVEIYNKEGNVVKTQRATDCNYFADSFQVLQGINKNPIDDGKLCIYKGF